MNKRWKKIVLYAAALIIAALAVFVYWITWTGNTDHIESVADQFKADSSWELVSDHVKPPKTVCIEGGCPSLNRTWITSKPLTQDELSDVVKRSGWNDVKIEKGCEPRKDSVCPVRGTVDKYEVVIYVSDGASRNEGPSLSVHID